MGFEALKLSIERSCEAQLLTLVLSSVSLLLQTMEGRLGVRKGAWTDEEDVLLRKCIEDFGEGKWHQVPTRAGLNRCRKSCRLRWLNYLRPNIKRGNFTPDEVDLIMRLHKLLGNRWSLIAGRIPGRTSNDVKNYWNTHLYKKMVCGQEKMKDKTQKTVKTNVIKPRPRTFSKNLTWLRGQTTNVENNNILSKDNNLSKALPITPLRAEGGNMPWWESFLFDKESDKGVVASSSSGWSREEPTASLWDEDNINVGNTCVEQGQLSDWNEFSVNINIWDLLNGEQETV